MAVATLDNIEKTFGKRVLFDHLSLTIYEGERIGLIGANGSGKTSLFKVLVGQLAIDAGTAAVTSGVKVGYLTQDPAFTPGNTVLDEAELAFSDLHKLAHRLRDLEHAMAEQSGEALEKTLKRYQTAQHDFDVAGGYVWHHKLEATLQGVGLARETWEQTVETLSGGQRSRLALAKMLISEPDLLLLDEPTNHLDLSAIEWLENYLLDFEGSVVLISHDRFLLDRLVTRIAWLHQQKISTYKGNYTAFVAQRELAELTQQRQFEEQQADIEKQKEFIRRFGAGQRSKEAKGREKRLNRLLVSDKMVEQVESQKQINLKLGTEQRAGDQVLRVKELTKGYDGRTLWDRIGFHVKRGERIGVIGPNGAGKTTLLEVLLGRRDADGGEVRWGANLNIGYYDQRLDQFEPDSTVMEEVIDGAAREGIKQQEARDVLATLLFRGEDVHKPVGLLSGGERARVRLAQLLLDRPNVLVLDEPTNHLDIASCEALEGALRDFPGTILCVSHDRYFLDKTVRRLLVLDPPRLNDYEGTYSAWARKMADDAKQRAEREATAAAAKSRSPSSASSSSASSKPAKKNADNPYLRPFGRLSMAELEQQISDTELAIAEYQQSFGDADRFRDAARGRQAQAEYDQLAKKLQQLEAEYFAREE
jgi:ATP-binding cassette, subfamily F, member 3